MRAGHTAFSEASSAMRHNPATTLARNTTRKHRRNTMPKKTNIDCPSCGKGKLTISGDHLTCTKCNFRNIEGTGKKIVLDDAFKSGDKI